jgi:hypothetical protein
MRMLSYVGEDQAADLRAQAILTELRSFVDEETIDGRLGVASAWAQGLTTLQDLEDARVRFLNMREMVKRLGY